MLPRRPVNTDTMDDVLKMQNDYLKEKEEGKLKPAAQAISLSGNKGTKRQSIFAQQRNLKKSSQESSSSKQEVIKDVVERKYNPLEVNEISNLKINDDEDGGFPKVFKIDDIEENSLKGKSIFSQMMKSKNKQGDKVDDLHKGIHEENVKTLDSLSHEEIMEEREKLIKSMDPKLLEFLKSKKRRINEDQIEPMEVEVKKEQSKMEIVEEFPALEILKDENSKNWLNMDVIEPEKLEWTKNVEKITKNLKPGESYEARFDWKGFLLPYTTEDENKDDRELYLHGEESHRPGYTLQELFRLGRSTVLQQRVSAITSIAGILNIYNQGYYDKILELPISKIFFFLRFALDENTSAIIEVASKALSYLFYNDTDETMLDILHETKNGFIQPIMDNSMANEKISEGFEEISTKTKLFESSIDDFIDKADEDREKENVNDFHMAEVNLMECLIRTNIIERISYILISTNPNENTSQACLKILIRITRTSEEFAMKILNKRNLMDILIRDPTYLSFKLFRILSTYSASIIENLKSLGAIDKAKQVICTQSDISVTLLKIQIECFRFLRLYYHLTNADDINELFMAMRFFLEWHYQNLEFQPNHFIIRTHAAALLYLLSTTKIHISFSVFAESLKMCCSKWFFMAYRHGVDEFSQKMLLSSVLDVASAFMGFSSEFFYGFIDDYLIKFLTSNHFKEMQENLKSTPLFNKLIDRCNVHKPLINIGSVVRRGINSAPSLVYTQDYSVIFMDSILSFIDNLKNNNNNARNANYHQKLIKEFSTSHIESYLQEFSKIQKRPKLAANWFMKIELKLIFKLLFLFENSFTLQLAFSLVNCLTSENFINILVIFKEFLFNERFYNNQTEDLERWKYIFNGIVDSKIAKNDFKKFPATIEKWNQILLDKTWTYSLLLILFYNAEINPTTNRLIESELSEKEIIMTTLKFNKLLQNHQIKFISSDQELMYLMLIYFGKDLNFLDEDVRTLIEERLKDLSKSKFSFNQKLNNEKSFENLYTMFLDYFQANSYGDELFSTFLMIPLAQKYDVKWRKMVWSEYAMVLRFLTCGEDKLNIDDYLYPLETDVSLIKSYASALSSNYLRKDSFPYKIADHHVRKSRHLFK